MTGPLLVDLGAIPDECCSGTLDHLFKSLAEDPHGQPESIWAPHENGLLTAHVETWTARMQAILQALQDALSQALFGERVELRKAEAPWLRLDEAGYIAERARLEAKPPRLYDLEDWLSLVDLLIFSMLGPGVINSEAEYLTVRAFFSGKIQDAMERPTPNQPAFEAYAKAMEWVPTAFRQVPPKVLTETEHAILLCAKERAATAISNVSDQTRARMRTIIIEHVQGNVLGQPEGQNNRLATRLFDEFGQLNRDMRRIAVTEAGEASGQGFIMSQRPGSKVERIEAYRGACDWCKSISGKVFTVADPADPQKNGDTDVWVGKTNIGRSASPRKRTADGLVERASNDRWWVAAGVQHPHCRGRFVRATTGQPLEEGVDPAFAAYLDATLEKVIAQATGKSVS